MTDNNQKNCPFRVLPKRILLIIMSHGLSLIILGHVLLAIVAGPNHIRLIPLLIVTLMVFILLGIASFIQIKYTCYEITADIFKIKVGIRKYFELKWIDIEEIKHVPFKPFYKHQFKFITRENDKLKKVGLNLSFIDMAQFKKKIVKTLSDKGCVKNFFQNYDV